MARSMVRRSRRGRQRRLQLERLEVRLPLASSFTNPLNNADVNDDGLVTAVDALSGINYINSHPGDPSLPDTGPPPYLDTNGNGTISPVDVLVVINRINGDAASPVIDAFLTRDTAAGGTINSDGVTSDATIGGSVSDGTGVLSLQARLDGGSPVAVPHQRDGSFELRTQTVFPGIGDGPHSIELRARDPRGNESTFTVSFTLDTTAPDTPVFDLSSDTDSDPDGDGVTNFSIVRIVGGTAPQMQIDLLQTGDRTTSDLNGDFQIENVDLALGPNTLTIRATDPAGNESQSDLLVTREERANVPPVVDPIGALTTMPGLRLEVPLSASDADGDPVTFSIVADGPFVKSTLRADGVLVFTPTPAQLGTFPFTVVASDGRSQGTRQASIEVVADPITTTRLSGTILDTLQNPLEGVRLEVAGVVEFSDASGAFQFDFGHAPFPGDTLLIDPAGVPGSEVFPFIAEKLPLLLGHEAFAGINNLIERPIFLPALDLANAVTIDPTSDALVTTAMIPGTELFVAAGTLTDRGGSPYSGPLSITEVPVDFTPAALPFNTAPDLVITIQPGDMVFTQPAPVTFPNTAGWPPGMMLDLFSIDPVTGDFADVGDMRVSADGLLIETISGGVRNSSWHYTPPPPPPPPPPEDDDHDEDDDCEICKETEGASSDVELHSGALLETHELVTYQSQGVSRGLTLAYKSTRANPQPIIHTGLLNTPADSDQLLVVEMRIERGEFSQQVPGFDPGPGGRQFGLDGGEHFWQLPPGGGDVKVALQVDLNSQPSGRYTAVVDVGLKRFNGEVFVGSTSRVPEEFLLVNSSSSSLGAGWGIAGLQHLVEEPDGSILLVDGDGNQVLFPFDGQLYHTPAGDRSTFEKLGDNTYRRTTQEQEVHEFDTQGRLVRTTDRNGNSTEYAYTDDLLTSITDPVGLITTLAYQNGLLQSITDPASRVTLFEHDAAGNLTRITDPDGSFRTFSYDARHRMTSEVTKRGDLEQTIYGFHGRVVRAVLADGAVKRYATVQPQGLVPAEQTVDPFQPAMSTALPQPPRASVTDGEGRVTEFLLTKGGQLIQQIDPVGAGPRWERLPGGQAGSFVDARGNVTVYDRDARLNIVTARDAIAGSGAMIGQIDRPGDRHVHAFQGQAGQWIFVDRIGPGGNLFYELMAPSGQLVLANVRADSDRGPVVLTETGAHQLILGAGNSTGPYDLRLYTPSRAASPLAFNSATAGSIDVPGEQDVYQIEAAAGQRLFYDGRTSVGGDLRVSLLSPTGEPLINFATAGIDHGSLVLQETGTYQLVLQGSGDDTGQYEFVLFEAGLTTLPLALSTPIEGSIASPGDSQVYQFEGQVGQRLMFDSQQSLPGDLRASLIAPGGIPLFEGRSSDGDVDAVTLAETGTYRLLLFGAGDDTGDYRFQLAESTISSTPVTLSTVVSGTIDAPGAVDELTFTASVGQRVFVDSLLSDPAADLRFTLLAPDGERLLNAVSSDGNHGPLTLDMAGQYRLLVAGVGDDTGPYQFELVEPDVRVTPLTLGSRVTDSLVHPGDVHTFTFAAAAGQRIYFDSLVSLPEDLRVSVVGPTGTLLALNLSTDSDFGPLVLSETGSYLLHIQAVGDTVGAYDFRLLETAASALALAVPVSGTLDPGRGAVVFQHQGTQGQRLALDSMLSGNGNWGIVGPGGNAIIPFLNMASDFAVTLPSDGPYELVLTGFSIAGPVPFMFQVDDVSDAPVAPAGLGVIQAGMIEPGEQEVFQFDAPAGLPIYVDMQRRTTTLNYTLRDPFGASLAFNSELDDVGPLVLPFSGTYTITVAGDNAGSTGEFRFQVLGLGDDSTPIAGNMQVDLEALGAAILRIDAVIGEQIFYDGLENDFDSVAAVLLSPSMRFLTTLNSDFSAGPFPVTETGSYFVLIRNDTTVARDARFQVVKPTTSITAAQFDQMFAGELSVPGERDVYAFQGTVGQRVFFDTVDPGIDSMSIELIAPSGTRAIPLHDEDLDRGPLALEETGTYQLHFVGTGDATGDYAFVLRSALRTVGPLTIDGETSGTLDSPGENDVFTFEGTVGQRLYFDALDNDPDGLNIQLLSPLGASTNHDEDVNLGPIVLGETGTYQLTVFGSGDATGDYRFRLGNAPLQRAALALGAPLTGTIDVPGEVDQFTFQAMAGQRLFFDSLVSDPDALAVALRDPLGRLLFNGHDEDADLGPLRVVEPGEYSLYMFGSFDAIGDYSFQLIDAPVSMASLALNEVTSGVIAVPGEADVFTFQGVAGHRLLFDPRQVPADDLRVTLVAPSGTVQLGALDADADLGPIVLTEDGVYQLTLHGAGDAVGGYEFVLFDLDAGGAAELTLDAPLNVTLSPGSSTQVLAFEGRAGERLFLDARGASGPLSWRVLRSNGDQVAVAGAAVDLTAILPADDLYFLRISGNNFAGDVTFSFAAITVEMAPVAVSFGTLIEGSIDEPGDVDVFTFTAAAGQRIAFDSLGANVPIDVRVTRPSGELLFDNTANFDTELSWQIETGTYRIEIDAGDDQLGDYAFRLINHEAAATLVLNQVVNAPVDAGAITSLRFNGFQGQRLRVTGLGSVFDGRLQLYGTNGLLLLDRNLASAGEVTLAANGSYVLVVDIAAGADPGVASFRVDDISDALVPSSGLPIEQAGLIAAGQRQDFNFSASAGELILFDQRLSLASDPLTAEIRTAGGALLVAMDASQGDIGPFPLPASGDYTLSVFGDNAASTGPFAFGLFGEQDAQTITVDQRVDATFNSNFETDLYRFHANAGQWLYLDMLQTNLAQPLRVRMTSPNGAQLLDLPNSFPGFGPLVFGETGTYLLSMAGQGAAGNYSFELLDILAARPLPIEQQVNEATAGGVEVDLFVLDGTAGQRLFFDSISTQTFGPRWRMFGPGNLLLFDANIASDREATLPLDGVYTLIVDDRSPAADSYSFRVLERQTIERAVTPEALMTNGGVGFTYDPNFNQPANTTDELVRQTLRQIDPNNGNLLSLTRVVGMPGGPDDVVTSFTYTLDGLVDTIIDPLGRVTDHDYDARGNRIATTYAVGTPVEGTRLFEYDNAGNLTAVIDELGNRTQVDYDELNRPIMVTEPDPDGPGPATSPVTQFTYDEAGNLLTTVDARGSTTRFEYDALHRRTRVIDHRNQETHLVYDRVGNLISVTDPLQNTTTYRYDARNRPIEVLDAAGARTLLDYDLDDNLIRVTDASGNITRFEYDARNRLTGIVNALGQASVQTYDAVDNRISRTDRLGRQTRFDYDELNRLITETWVGDGNLLQYTYDPVGNLLSAADNFSSITVAYDDRDRPTMVDNAGTPHAPRVVLTYAHDLAGNLLSTTDSVDGQQAADTLYQYDALNRLTRIVQSAAGLAPVSDKRVDFSYNALSQFDTIARYADLAGTQAVADSVFQFDDLNRLTSLTHDNVPGTLAFYNYTYDPTGRIASIEDVDGLTTYTLDALGQLLQADRAPGALPDESYVYDATGNRASSHLHGMQYEVGTGNRLESDGVFDYTYDAEGNLRQRTEVATGASREFTWDHRHRLTEVVDRDAQGTQEQRVEFVYDALNRRIAKTVADANGDTAWHFAYDRDELLLEFVDDDGVAGGGAPQLARRYLHGPAVDQVLADEDAAGNVRWLLSDHLGTVRDLVDESGQLVDHLTYDSYGNLVAQTGSTEPRHLYTGREFDRELGLHYYRARYLDSTTGRFLSEDPLGFAAGQINLFAYVANNPLDFRDPTGLQGGFGGTNTGGGGGFGGTNTGSGGFGGTNTGSGGFGGTNTGSGGFGGTNTGSGGFGQQIDAPNQRFGPFGETNQTTPPGNNGQGGNGQQNPPGPTPPPSPPYPAPPGSHWEPVYDSCGKFLYWALVYNNYMGYGCPCGR
ncbi:MAG: hypothetical protein J5I93_29765 [Pirellulaceae bacterium]|nr:hypothetical protein [Pirellulaceae bacterium]